MIDYCKFIYLSNPALIVHYPGNSVSP